MKDLDLQEHDNSNNEDQSLVECSMDELSEEDEWLSSPNDQFQRQFSDAIALVIRDANTVLGKGVITHVVDEAEEQFLREIGPDVDAPPGHLMINGRPRGGFSWHSEMAWPDFVISAAEGIQEAVFEGDDFWGMPFPPCPVHPNHPLVPSLVEGIACWTCARGSIEPVEIGRLQRPCRRFLNLPTCDH